MKNMMLCNNIIIFRRVIKINIERAGGDREPSPVATPEECADDPEKADVKLLYMPAEKQPSEKPFVIALAGGAYTCVCSIVESIPTTARLNELHLASELMKDHNCNKVCVLSFGCGKTIIYEIILCEMDRGGAPAISVFRRSSTVRLPQLTIKRRDI